MTKRINNDGTKSEKKNKQLGCVNVKSVRKGFFFLGFFFINPEVIQNVRGYKFEMKFFFMLFKLIQIINKAGVKEEFDKIQIENVTFRI